MAALRSAPPPAGMPKPATFMASPEKLKSAIPVAAPIEPEAKTGPVIAAMPVAKMELAPEPKAKLFNDQGCPELRAMIDGRDQKKAKSLKRQSLTMTFSLLAVLSAVGGWIVVSPAAQAKVARVVPLLKESAHDVKPIANAKGEFDKSLDKISANGAVLDEASRQLGVDPTTVPAEAGEGLDGGMKDMMGGEGRTTSERDKEMQEKLGVAGNLLGDKE